MRKIALLAALAALVVAAIGASAASADIIPAGGVSASGPATFKVSFFSNNCTMSSSFTAGSNGPVAMSASFSSCSICPATAASGWTIEGHESPGTDDTVNDNTVGTVTVHAPAGNTINCSGCTVTTSAVNTSTSYTDGGSSISFPTVTVPFTASGSACGFFGIPSSGNGSFSATQNISSPVGGLTIR